MDSSFLSTTQEALAYFKVDEHQGLSSQQVQHATGKYGRNGTVYLLTDTLSLPMLKASHQLYPRILLHLCGNLYWSNSKTN